MIDVLYICSMQKTKILLLGSGELGKELVISLKRLGEYVVACDNYANAPAMQVADEFEVFNMLDAAALDSMVEKHNPKLIVPEIESIRTERFFAYEEQGYNVVPSARAANFTMNRKLIRDLAAKELNLRTAKYAYATNKNEFDTAVHEIGMPCVVKPLMSSSGKGQSVVRSKEDLETSFTYAMEGSRGDLKEIIIEAFVEFHTEITLLTVTQEQGETLFCPAIGHRQERGDYQESWQPCILIANFQAAQGKLSGALSRLMVTVERYPDLKANQNFLALQSQLEGTENRIKIERDRFNESVKNFNGTIRKFPKTLLASSFGFEKKGYFEADQGTEQAPEVSF